MSTGTRSDLKASSHSALLRPFALTLACLLPVLATASDGQAQSLQQVAERIIVEERRSADAPALSAIVIRNGEVLARVADGMADLSNGVEVGLDTAFPAGSVTKTLTAALVMTEVDAGRLTLDAPIAPYLPPDLRPLDANGAEVDVTLRQLLSHSSGLPVTWDGFPPDPQAESREAYIAASRILVHPPGDRLVYSNVGFVLAGEVAAASAGMSFEELAQARLFSPLGMTRSSLGLATDYHGSLAAGHKRFTDGTIEPEPHVDLTALAAAGSLLTTPDDLARFARMIANGGVFDGARVLSVDAVDEMMALQAQAHPDLEEGFGLGFGVRIGEDGNRTVWWDGTTTSAAAHLAVYPASGTAVIAMTNIADNHPTSVAGRRLLEQAVPGLAAAPASAAPALDGIDGYYLAADLVDPDLWFFAYAMPFHVQSGVRSVRVSSQLVGSMTLVPVTTGHFRVEGSMLDGAGAFVTEELLQIGFVHAERLPAYLTPPAFMAYAGVLALLVLLGLSLALRAIWRRVR